MQSIKCVLVGDSFSCKRHLIVAYATNRFPQKDSISLKLCDNYCAVRMIDGEPHCIDLIDTAPEHECYDRFRPLSYTEADGLLQCHVTSIN